MLPLLILFVVVVVVVVGVLLHLLITLLFVVTRCCCVTCRCCRCCWLFCCCWLLYTLFPAVVVVVYVLLTVVVDVVVVVAPHLPTRVCCPHLYTHTPHTRTHTHTAHCCRMDVTVVAYRIGPATGGSHWMTFHAPVRRTRRRQRRLTPFYRVLRTERSRHHAREHVAFFRTFAATRHTGYQLYCITISCRVPNNVRDVDDASTRVISAAPVRYSHTRKPSAGSWDSAAFAARLHS